MTQKTKSSNYLFSFSMLALTVFVAVISAIFIIKYCELFDDLGIVAKKRLENHPLATFFITPIFFWISAYICRAYSQLASGNKLHLAFDELKKDPNNFDKVSTFLNIRLVMIKAISSLIANLGGGALGKEGPSVHMSAGIFAVLANRYKRFLPKISLENWVFAGTACGLAIAFNAPIAGIVFVIEKLAKRKFKNFGNNIIWTLVMIAIVTIIFHKPHPLFNFHNLVFKTENESLWLIFTAITCGVLALAFQATNSFFYAKIFNIKSNWWHLIPVSAGIIVAYINFYCGIYSFSGGIFTAQEALSNSSQILSYKEVGGRILNTIITFASGCAGGLIAPSIAIGTGIGSIISILSDHEIDVFLLIGMVSFLGAVLGEPITAAIIVFETTGQDWQNIPFLIAATIIATTIFKKLAK
ncbi:MAG: chloride channel protein [Rickettsiales bacterium]|nr:chloride channel protein [Rickettsiales bacterium]